MCEACLSLFARCGSRLCCYEYSMHCAVLSVEVMLMVHIYTVTVCLLA